MNKLPIRKSEIISRLTYDSPDLTISKEDKEYILYLENYIREKGYVLFHELKPEERKKLELEYVKKYNYYKSIGDEEKMKEYIERIVFGNIYFIILKAKRGFMRRIDTSVSLSDIIGVAILGMIKALNTFKVDNEWDARFLRYAEKFIEGNIYSLLYYKGPGNVVSFGDIKINKEKNYPNKEEFMDEEDVIIPQDNENLTYQIEEEKETCPCVYTVLEFLNNSVPNFPEEDYISCLLLLLLDENSINCIMNNYENT